MQNGHHKNLAQILLLLEKSQFMSSYPNVSHPHVWPALSTKAKKAEFAHITRTKYCLLTLQSSANKYCSVSVV